MARITVEDCQAQVGNRFLLVQMAIKRVYQYREGYSPLVASKNKEVVTALREIAAGKILPDADLDSIGLAPRKAVVEDND
ncbi:MAG: DNA-directed RNA polymerase subunit omega [Desulfovibrionaceae bacterium]|nr:DNA-directed RNA polymerase subunit omega [Desulfovibrionaceae bacterium]